MIYINFSQIGVLIGLVTLFVIVRHSNEEKIEKIIDEYVSFLNARSENDFFGKEIEFLIKAGALKLNNSQLKQLRLRIKERGIRDPFDFCKDLKEVKNKRLKKLLIGYKEGMS